MNDETPFSHCLDWSYVANRAISLADWLMIDDD